MNITTKMQYKTNKLMPVALGLGFLISMFYCIRFNVIGITNYDGNPKLLQFNRKPMLPYNGTEDFLIDTPGCYIPRYSKNLYIKPKNLKKSCGQRAVFIEKVGDDSIVFHYDNKKIKSQDKCCYRFVKRSDVKEKKDTEIIYSPCKFFRNGTIVQLEEEVITVACVSNQQKTVYSDKYVIIKKLKSNTEYASTSPNKLQSWNVLLLGMDTMSRTRIYNTMPKTVEYLLKHGWLDYRGYQKVASNTYPNLMSVLTGMDGDSSYLIGAKGMDGVNKKIMWSKFRESGFATAYGEDYLNLPDTFNRYGGFQTPPTDHYMRPFFLTKEYRSGNLICTGRNPSGLHILDYALDFTKTYRDEKFFGMFWINSYSHNLDNIPTLLENNMKDFFKNLEDIGILNTTFVIFFSDHGIRFGDARVPVESYYDERLPMFFMWVPHKFREQQKEEYYNLKLNQNRLITPYDHHLTLWNILKFANNSVEIVNLKACPRCKSLFQEISQHRTCADAGVDEKWCSCHTLTNSDPKDVGTNHSLYFVESYIQNKTRLVKTTRCMSCSKWKLKKIVRHHTYTYNNISNKTYYVIAIMMAPGDVMFEATVERYNNTYQILPPTDTISPYNTRGSCVVINSARAFCVCVKVCNKKT